MSYDTPVQVSTSSCRTIYKVGEHEIELGIIVGGTPALDFTCFGYSKRYPIIDERWMSCDFSKEGFPETGNWIEGKGCFKHQDPNNIQGPTYDVLPKGLATIYDYLDEMIPKKKLRESRLAQFPCPSIFSKRYHDKENSCYFRLYAAVDYGRIPCVTVNSAIYGGRCEENLKFPCVSKEWKEFAAFTNPLFDSNKFAHLDDLTEDDFQTLLKLYKKLINKS